MDLCQQHQPSLLQLKERSGLTEVVGTVRTHNQLKTYQPRYQRVLTLKTMPVFKEDRNDAIAWT